MSGSAEHEAGWQWVFAMNKRNVLEQEDQLHANLRKEGEKTRFAWDILLGVACTGGPMLLELKWALTFPKTVCDSSLTRRSCIQESCISPRLDRGTGH